MRTTVIAVVVLLVVISGCTASQSWQLGANGTVERVDDTYRFTGEVGLSGKVGGVTVEGVRVVFLDSNNTTLETVRIEMLGNERHAANLSVALERLPRYVLVFVEEVNAPESSEFGIVGLERRDDGNYYPYSEYDPFS